MEILIIGGFLGAGKTTTLAQIAGYLTHTMHDQVVIFENEISDTGVDDQLLTRSGFQVKEMLAGCICCSSSAQLTDTIKEIENVYHPKWLIIEATGLAYPDAIWDTIHTEFQIDAKIITLLDASRWMRLQKAMPQFADAQLRRADVIIINKTDLVTDKQLLQIRDSLQRPITCAHILERSMLKITDTGFWENMFKILEASYV